MATFTRTFGSRTSYSPTTSEREKARQRARAITPATAASGVSAEAVGDTVVLKIATWNVDGLCDDYRPQRTRESARILLSTRADVIFLQEVVADSQRIFEQALGQAYAIAGGAGGDGCPYWTLAFVRRDHRVVRARRDAFTGAGRSAMGRDLLLVDIAVATSSATAAAADATGGRGSGAVVVRCITSHLESTKQMARQRVGQLEQIASVMHEFDGPAVCGGDFNMRDVEQTEALKGKPLVEACVLCVRVRACCCAFFARACSVWPLAVGLTRWRSFPRLL
jgi:endonuclease/exonuclease/phosphatase family metal-dependent hydrolase